MTQRRKELCRRLEQTRVDQRLALSDLGAAPRGRWADYAAAVRELTGSTMQRTLRGSGSIRWENGEAGVLPSVVIGGKTEQQRYSGKNLCDMDADGFNAASFWSKGTFMEESFNRISLRGNTQYTVSWDASLPEGSVAIYYIRFAYTDGTSSAYAGFHVVDHRDSRRDGYHSITSVAGKTVERIIGQGATEGPLTLHWLQVEEGAQATAWEPYTGGVPVPNPNCPVMPVVSEGTVVESSGGERAVAPRLCAVPDSRCYDTWDAQSGEGVRCCAEIESYAGEEITTPYISSTGELSAGAYVIYGIPPVPFFAPPVGFTQQEGAGEISQTGGNVEHCPLQVTYRKKEMLQPTVTARPVAEGLEIRPEEGYDAMTEVCLKGDVNFQPWNIRAGVEIWGKTGSAAAAEEVST